VRPQEEKTAMSEHSGDGERQRRLDALRNLIQQAAPQTDAQPTETTAPHPALADDHAQVSGGYRRWRRAALIGVAVVIVVAIAGGVILRGAGHSGQPGANTTPALAVKGFDLNGIIYCASQPAWSPDGKQLAVFGQTNLPTDNCVAYNPQIDAATNGGGIYHSSNVATGFALVILNSATGHVTHRETLPAPSPDALCAGASGCQIQNTNLQSLAWTPDGHSIALFLTYELLTGTDPTGAPLNRQEAGALLIVQPGVGAPPRLLVAATPIAPANGSGEQAGLPLITWNLKTGAANVSAIPGALTGATPPYIPAYAWQASEQYIQITGDTIPFAPSYQWTADGQLRAAPSSATTPAASAITPWRSGVVGERRSPSDPVLYRTSQWLWSADGQYVTPDLATSAFLNLPGTNAAPATDGYMPPLVNPPNGANSAAIPLATGSEAGMTLAQSPDGTLLATLNCAPNDTAVLSIRANKGSDPLAQTHYTYLSGVLSLACYGDLNSLVWSPDGTRIATIDEQDAQIIVWQVNVRG
jgi:hypothetical protein